ncbi:ScbR family autoregulator-binding transcription factor [Streptomyces sp. DT24]|uniref:ScbR family autoregulator-binding transcription factor n=1 Tax=unclassified Streptomyces TaxID=2593676 RepID=UPI0023B9261D|nr:ScbR family autoregulator-binding transcription factor [Streptomyces sp. AM 4-1-1]WEH36885.1 ScbR family autoregulator-binding transcription factor [Streptomyces sp. AM 4-1-1]
MAMQERAVRTRRAILEAAARVFDRRGYQAATITEILTVAGVTKGALYFHFQSKEDLAHGIVAEQDLKPYLPSQSSKLQELVDIGMVHAYRVQTDLLVRAGVRLTLDSRAEGLDRTGPFLRWGGSTRELLDQAREQGELLPHVDTQETADLYVGSFAGVQSMSHIVSGYQDLGRRIQVLQRHVLPSIAVPSVIAALDLSPDRGRILSEQALASVAASEAVS